MKHFLFKVYAHYKQNIIHKIKSLIDNKIYLDEANTNSNLPYIIISTSDESLLFVLRGIHGLSPVGGKWTNLPSLNENEKNKMLYSKAMSVNNYQVGSEVLIKDGLFLNYKGIIVSTDIEKKICSLTIDVFGRSTIINLKFDQIENKI